MAYSLIEQQTRDLDLFLKDNEKLIHIASAGGQIPEQLADNEIENERFSAEVSIIEQIFEIEINPILAEIIEIKEDKLENYLGDFVQMASRGFYSYDKTEIGKFESRQFHLVAQPKPNQKSFETEIASNLLKIKRDMPNDFQPFDLFEYFDP